MADTAAHLVDRVLPAVPYRQWVLSLPIPVRLLLLREPALVTPTLRIFVRRIFAWTRRIARGMGIADGRCAAVTFIQRAGGALNAKRPLPHGLCRWGLRRGAKTAACASCRCSVRPTPRSRRSATRSHGACSGWQRARKTSCRRMTRRTKTRSVRRCRWRCHLGRRCSRGQSGSIRRRRRASAPRAARRSRASPSTRTLQCTRSTDEVSSGCAATACVRPSRSRGSPSERTGVSRTS
jgi:hypothetical protein